MNILVLDRDPKKCAEYHCDKHVVNFVLAYSQFLSTAHWIGLYNIESAENCHFEKMKDMKIYFESKYKKCNPKRPPYNMHFLNNKSTNWLYKSKENYLWLCELHKHLCNEFEMRYNKEHKTKQYSDWFFNNFPEECSSSSLTEFYINVPDYYKISEDPVECYREFYVQEKSKIATWKNRETPEWFE